MGVVISEIDYLPCPTTVGTGYELLGAYRVRYADRFTVLIPHQGVVGTVGAEPLDPSEDEHREILVARAERLRADYDEGQPT